MYYQFRCMIMVTNKYIWVQLAGVPAAARIQADTMEVDEMSGITTATLGKEKAAEFQKGVVIGWWKQD
jgi:hypothetical protein